MGLRRGCLSLTLMRPTTSWGGPEVRVVSDSPCPSPPHPRARPLVLVLLLRLDGAS